jgi:hypothetical protein
MSKLASLLVLASLSLNAADFCSWEDTPNYFQRQRVQLKLDSGIVLEGYWRGITPTAASFYVAKTSDSKTYPKGMRHVPRVTIRSAGYRTPTIMGKMIGLIGGYFTLAPLVYYAGIPELALPVLVGGIVGSTILGHAFDRRWHSVHIIPPQDITPPATLPRSLETPSSPANLQEHAQ